jgi:hypothetical protein
MLLGVYKPVRWYSDSRSMAAFCTFVASGMIHEYVGYLLYFDTTGETKDSECLTCNNHIVFGKQFIFFTWNGVLMLLEYKFGSRLVFIDNYLFKLLRNHLVVLLSLPLGYLLTDDMTSSGYFAHFSSALPVIKFSKLTTMT